MTQLEAARLIASRATSGGVELVRRARAQSERHQLLSFQSSFVNRVRNESSRRVLVANENRRRRKTCVVASAQQQLSTARARLRSLAHSLLRAAGVDYLRDRRSATRNACVWPPTSSQACSASSRALVVQQHNCRS